LNNILESLGRLKNNTISERDGQRYLGQSQVRELYKTKLSESIADPLVSHERSFLGDELDLRIFFIKTIRVFLFLWIVACTFCSFSAGISLPTGICMHHCLQRLKLRWLFIPRHEIMYIVAVKNQNINLPNT
jgi:hypothetical protein